MCGGRGNEARDSGFVRVVMINAEIMPRREDLAPES